MIFLQHKKRRRFFIPVLQAAALAVLFFLFFSSAIKNFLISKSLKLADFLMPDARKLEESRDQILMLSGIKALRLENKKLNDLLGTQSAKKIFPAKLSFGGGYLFLDAYFLNAGGERFKIGDWVLKDDVFLGKISEVGAGWSKFKPPGFLGEKTAMRAGANKELLFEATGMGGGELSADLPASASLSLSGQASSGLNSGDLVWLGEDPDYLVGFVDEIRARETSPSAEIIIITPLKIERLSEVEVLAR